MLVAEVVEDVWELKLSGTAPLPASPTSPAMPGYVPAAFAATGFAVRLKVFSFVELVVPQLVLAPPNPLGNVPVIHHK